jgi:type II secretory ATPase GspE/PulE/Tfp pilus assembly ATPase PilB-like protein
MAVAQRLLRQLCVRCRQPRELADAEALALNMPEAAAATVYEPAGCLYCAGRGFTGRLGLFELLPVDSELSRCIAHDACEAEIVQRVRDRNQPLLLENGAAHALAGQTTVREVLGAAVM